VTTRHVTIRPLHRLVTIHHHHHRHHHRHETTHVMIAIGVIRPRHAMTEVHRRISTGSGKENENENETENDSETGLVPATRITPLHLRLPPIAADFSVLVVLFPRLHLRLRLRLCPFSFSSSSCRH